MSSLPCRLPDSRRCPVPRLGRPLAFGRGRFAPWPRDGPILGDRRTPVQYKTALSYSPAVQWAGSWKCRSMDEHSRAGCAKPRCGGSSPVEEEGVCISIHLEVER